MLSYVTSLLHYSQLIIYIINYIKAIQILFVFDKRLFAYRMQRIKHVICNSGIFLNCEHKIVIFECIHVKFVAKILKNCFLDTTCIIMSLECSSHLLTAPDCATRKVLNIGDFNADSSLFEPSSC